MQEVIKDNPTWFKPEARRLFGDLGYMIRIGEKTNQVYLVQHTNAWTDMFGGNPEPHYRLHSLSAERRTSSRVKSWDIGNLLPEVFQTMSNLNTFIRNN